jgi:glycogen debranching enzyme
MLAVPTSLPRATAQDSAAPQTWMRSATDRLDERRYVAAGDRAYVVGMADGSFAPMGWHISGQMGGVWMNSIKAANAYWLAVDGAWLPPAERFTSAPGYVRFDYPAQDGIAIQRTEFAPDGLPVVMIGLTLTTPADFAPRDAEIALHIQSNLMASYPWTWSTPTSAADFDRPDVGEFDAGRGWLLFREPERAWNSAVGMSAESVSGAVGADYFGSVESARLRSRLGDGAGGELRANVSLAAGETTIWVAIAASHTSDAEAHAALETALRDPDALLAAQIAGRMALLERSRVMLPDTSLQAAFDWGKLNLADMHMTVTDMQVRDVDEGRAYPAESTTIAEARGIRAGFPDYTSFFGTDGAYTTYALVASGQFEVAMDHLRAIRDFSRIVNGDTGKVVHEVTNDGSVYYGTNAHPGNTNETAQFAIAVDLLWRWTGDRAFLDEMYPFVRDGMRYILTELDQNGDGCPEGRGMVERDGMAHQTLDVAAYTVAALAALVDMSYLQGDADTNDWARVRLEVMGMASPIIPLEGWWIDDLGLYADSTEDCQIRDGQRQGYHWINATPMEMNIVSEARAIRVLDQLESPMFSGDTGLYHTGTGAGRGEQRVWTLPNSVMAVAEANYGRLGDDQALRYMRAIADGLDVEMPGALPEILPSPEYDVFGDLNERAMFMQAWSSYGVQWPLISQILGVTPLMQDRRVNVLPHLPPGWDTASVENLRVGTGSIDVSASRDGMVYTTRVSASFDIALTIGQVLPLATEVETVRVNGEPAAFERWDSSYGGHITTNVDVRAGETVEMVITTR